MKPSRLGAMGYGWSAGLGTVDKGCSTGMVAAGAETAPESGCYNRGSVHLHVLDMVLLDSQPLKYNGTNWNHRTFLLDTAQASLCLWHL